MVNGKDTKIYIFPLWAKIICSFGSPAPTPTPPSITEKLQSLEFIEEGNVVTGVVWGEGVHLC